MCKNFSTAMSHQAWVELLRPQNPLLVTHFLQQSHTCPNRATPSNSSILMDLWVPFHLIFQYSHPLPHFSPSPRLSYSCPHMPPVCHKIYSYPFYGHPCKPQVPPLYLTFLSLQIIVFILRKVFISLDWFQFFFLYSSG